MHQSIIGQFTVKPMHEVWSTRRRYNLNSRNSQLPEMFIQNETEN